MVVTRTCRGLSGASYANENSFGQSPARESPTTTRSERLNMYPVMEPISQLYGVQFQKWCCRRASFREEARNSGENEASSGLFPEASELRFSF
jgi:hypothetical protein